MTTSYICYLIGIYSSRLSSTVKTRNHCTFSYLSCIWGYSVTLFQLHFTCSDAEGGVLLPTVLKLEIISRLLKLATAASLILFGCLLLHFLCCILCAMLHKRIVSDFLDILVVCLLKPYTSSTFPLTMWVSLLRLNT